MYVGNVCKLNMNNGKNLLRENNKRQSIMIVEENILLTRSLDLQSYHTE